MLSLDIVLVATLNKKETTKINLNDSCISPDKSKMSFHQSKN